MIKTVVLESNYCGCDEEFESDKAIEFMMQMLLQWYV